MSKRSHRRWKPGGVAPLEGRTLLAAALPAAAGGGMNLAWLGQDGQDWTGPGAAVGPDGFQDADVALTQLSATEPVQSATLTSTGGQSWAFGTNPGLLPDAELIPVPGDPTQAHLYFSPTTNMAGQMLTLSVVYADATIDSNSVVAGATNPSLPMPVPTPVAVAENAFAATWIGQDGQNLAGPGAVHLALSGLPTGHTVVAVQLTDGTLNSWDYKAAGASLQDGNILPQPLAFRLSAADPTQADVGFAPVRDESQTTMTLRLILDDGTNLVTMFTGGAANLALLGPEPAATSVVAAPGADLNTLANEYGSVHLTAGTYDLSAPLVLNQPVTITADPGTTLLFAQAAAAPTWSTAIKINAGNTTLSGFAVRFTGPINWTSDVSYGPAVIGTTDNTDTGPTQPLENITLTGLDLQSPPAASAWELTPDLIRAISAQSGVISDNILKGGTTEFIGGPWQVVGNTYEGTLPDTYTFTAFAGHWTHDVVVANNQVEPVGPYGKTYRFLVLTSSGIGDVVKDNDVVGIGPMDDDTEPDPNANEVVLTESYDVLYEGVPMTISPDGMVVQISSVLADQVQAGDVLSILAGPDAGQWRQIALELNPTTFLLASPIDPGTTAISISQGFVNESFVGNTINTTGSSVAADLVLAGNQFGLQVRNNTLIGGGRAFWITAYASEVPLEWGWTHVPVLGATISGNTIENTIDGAWLVVEHGSAIKANTGRVYMSALLTNNTGIFTAAFLAQPSIAAATAPLNAFQVGMGPSFDPGELLVGESGNQVEGPENAVSGPTMLTASAVVNGQAESNQETVLPAVALSAPLGLVLVNDTGISGVDGQTSDPHLSFDPVPLAAGYEYSLTGAAGTYQPVSSPGSFLPQGLTPGFNSVFVRAYDVYGDRGPDALIEFSYVPASGSTPPASTPVVSRTVTYVYAVGSTGPTVPLGESIILNAAEEAAAPIAIQIQMVNLGGTGTSISTSPTIASGTGSQPSTNPPAGQTTTDPQPSTAGDSGSVPVASTGEDTTSPTPPPTTPVTTAPAPDGITSETTSPTPPPTSPVTTAPAPDGTTSDTSTSTATTPTDTPNTPAGTTPTVPPVVPVSGDSTTASTPPDANSVAAVPAATSAQSPENSTSSTTANAGEGATPVPPAASTAAAGPAQPVLQLVAQSATPFALASSQPSAAKVGLHGVKITHGSGLKHHPNPFRKAGASTRSIHGHSVHPSGRHAHPAVSHMRKRSRTK